MVTEWQVSAAPSGVVTHLWRVAEGVRRAVCGRAGTYPVKGVTLGMVEAATQLLTIDDRCKWCAETATRMSA